jgi:hypothetical protein
MSDFFLRTEDIRLEEMGKYFVENDHDRDIIEAIKGQNPVIIEGSRGTGKSFLIRMAEYELLNNYENLKILPVYISFTESTLIHTNQEFQFRNWMLAKICAKLIRALQKKNLHEHNSSSMKLIGGSFDEKNTSQIEKIYRKYESSWSEELNPSDLNSLITVDNFKDAIEDICNTSKIQRICFLFDEAAHVFRTEQQRQFFTLFRDLRSSFISCNAAIYPGITFFGSVFQPSHDAIFKRIERDVTSLSYINSMYQIVVKQASDDVIKDIDRNRGNFNAIAFSSNGNPRILLKILSKCKKMNSKEINSTLKDFFRSDIWSEHTLIGEKYPGHKKLVDWGRDFIENHVIPSIQIKNKKPKVRNRIQYASYFWIHRDSPRIIKESLRLLMYTGIINKIDDAVRGTGSQLGTRYSLNIGCITSLESDPILFSNLISGKISKFRFSQFFQRYKFFKSISNIDEVVEPDLRYMIENQKKKDISELDITKWQKNKLKEIRITSIGDILNTTEDEIKSKIDYVGDIRARKIYDSAISAVLEYLSG